MVRGYGLNRQSMSIHRIYEFVCDRCYNTLQIYAEGKEEAIRQARQMGWRMSKKGEEYCCDEVKVI